MTEPAPAKLNLCLFVGPLRDDGRHELVSVMQSLEWGDEVALDPADRDEVVCAGVEGPNLVAAALAGLRAATRRPQEPVRITVTKRIPIAAGLGGGSADAAATLRLVARAAGIEDEELLAELAAELGADVPAQVQPGRALAAGAGERVRRLSPPPPFGVLVLPSTAQLSTAAVYAEADRLGLPRDAHDLAERLWAVEQSLADERPPFGLGAELLVNDLEPAARALCPAIDAALDEARAAGADHALVAGSGPTVVGLFADPEEAREAAARLAGRAPAPIATTPLTSW
jgi:4-diphosphocytidyl-2-C-methyl-D-erythritol kinase